MDNTPDIPNTTSPTPPPADNANNAPPSATEAIDQAIKDGEQQQSAGDGDSPTPPPDDGATDLYKGIDLNGGEGKDGGDNGNPPKDNQPPAVSDEDYIKSLGIEGDAPVSVGKTESGEDITFSPAEAKAIAPALNKLGIPADKAKGVMGLYAHLDNARRAAWEKQDAEALDKMAQEAQKEFGEGLNATLKDMVRGCRHVFPDKLWQRIQTVRPLLYDTEFIRAMAKVGRDYAQDRGADGSQRAQPQSITENFTAERWFEGSNRNRNAN